MLRINRLAMARTVILVLVGMVMASAVTWFILRTVYTPNSNGIIGRAEVPPALPLANNAVSTTAVSPKDSDSLAPLYEFLAEASALPGNRERLASSPFDPSTSQALYTESFRCMARGLHGTLSSAEQKELPYILRKATEANHRRASDVEHSEALELRKAVNWVDAVFRRMREFEANCDLIKGPVNDTVTQAYRDRSLLVEIKYLKCLPQAPKQFTCSYSVHMRDGSGQVQSTEVKNERHHHINDKWVPVQASE